MSKVIASEISRSCLLGLCVTALTIGIAALILDASMENYEDAFEWILALLVHLYFLVMARAWKRTRFKVRYVLA